MCLKFTTIYNITVCICFWGTTLFHYFSGLLSDKIATAILRFEDCVPCSLTILTGRDGRVREAPIKTALDKTPFPNAFVA